MEPPAIGPSVKRQERKASWQSMKIAFGLTTKRDASGTIVQLRTEESRKEKAKVEESKEGKDKEKAAKEVKDDDL